MTISLERLRELREIVVADIAMVRRAPAMFHNDSERDSVDGLAALDELIAYREAQQKAAEAAANSEWDTLTLTLTIPRGAYPNLDRNPPPTVLDDETYGKPFRVFDDR